ncbi:lysophospholipase [Plasmodium brasilianum]|uniref:Lysophospholipase, putative n=2 Tax=Plasmodium (Plasmodium) TaxID=418103 RepID=A0A1A8X1L9_PLAMA|nr:lysophospholipase [Plasmodium brasilianum]SBS98061.1 lysophospholipase, putative [Plasmodium malariae]
MTSFKKIAPPGSYLYGLFYMPVTRIISSILSTIRSVSEIHYSSFPHIIDMCKYDKFRFKGGVTCRFVYEILRAMKNLNKDMEHFTKDIPILFIHSRNDCICYYGVVVSFYDKLKLKNKELYTIEDMDHILTSELSNENVLNKITD